MSATQEFSAMTAVRAGLIAKYAILAAHYPDQPGWFERLEAVRCGDVLVEPGWMLHKMLGDDVDIFGLYRVYPDGRIERDRFIEQLELDRFRSAGRDAPPETVL